MEQSDWKGRAAQASASFEQLNEARKPLPGVQWPITKRKSKPHSSTSAAASSSSHLPLKTSKFSIFEDTTNLRHEAFKNTTMDSSAVGGETSIDDDSLNLTFDKKKFTAYRAPLSEISFRSDTSIMSDSGVSAMDELEMEFDDENSLRMPNKLLLSTTRKNLARLCQSKLPSPILPPEKSSNEEEEEPVDENLKASPDFLPPSVAKHFAPKVVDDYFHIGGAKGHILSERKHTVYDFPEYGTEILAYWLKYEKRVKPKRWYMDKQPDISYKMRTILVDWLVEVGEEYDMHHETVFLAVGCLDRFLSKMSVTRSKLQLVGTAALFTCAKFEEIQPPDVNDFVTITDNTYTIEQVIQMERIMLNSLSFDLLVPTAFDFVRTFSSFLRLDSQTSCLAAYLTELSMLDGERYLSYLPSIIATAAIALSRYTFQNRIWDSKIEKLTTHKLTDIQRCTQDLFNSFYASPSMPQTAVFEKYKAVRFCGISLCILPANLPWNL